ncbi:hypothetical protein AB4Z55_25265 [Gordonia sp. ABKF26]|uniref:hypothetical protein n=1 Tax=Gordonia sp. ABKF26 TaxID=3238687 RepID=UPI0034E5FA27
MTHQLDRQDAQPAPRPASSHPRDSLTSSIVALISVVAIAGSLAMSILATTGIVSLLPMGVRVAVVVSVALVLPGLPIATLLRLPNNGLLAGVAIALSLSTNIIVSMVSLLVGFWDPLLQQGVILVVSGVATGALLSTRCPRPVSRLRSDLLMSGTAVRESIRTCDRTTVALLTASSAVFVVSIFRLRPEQAGVYGLVPLLGFDYLAGLLTLCAVLFREYRRRRLHPPTLAAANVLLVVYLSMPVAWSTGAPTFPTAFVHRFLTNWVSGLGALPPAVDGRVSWSGFFAGAAQVMQTGGLDDSMVFLTSASLVFGILMMFPLFALGHSLSGSARVGWATVTIYILFNWYQQDYFAPQAVAMQLYVTIIALLIWELRHSPLPRAGSWCTWRRTPGRPHGRSRGFEYAVEAIVIVLLAAMVVSHQLTPMVTIGALAGLALLGATRHKLLWLGALLVFSAWFTFGASGYWLGHLDQILGEIGDITASINSGVSERITGDPVYGRMQYLRIGGTLLLFVLATIGWFRLGNSRFRAPLAVIALAPFLLVIVQSYGGEVIVRCFLYSSPVLAALGAIIGVGSVTRLGGFARVPAAVLTIGTVALMFGVAVLGVSNRGLNTSFESSRPETVQVADALVAQAPPMSVAYWGQGSIIGLPRAYDIGASCIAEQRELAECTAAQDIDYLIVSAQDVKLLRYRYGVTPDEIARQLDLLVRRNGFASLYDDGEVHVLARAGARHLDLEATP